MSWDHKRIKDCCTVIGGATPKREIAEYWGGDIPWVTPKDISNLPQPVLEDAPEFLTEKGFGSASTYMLPKGAILLTSRAPIGNVAVAGRAMCTNQGFKSLIPGEGMDSSYLYHCMRREAPRLEAQGNGATFKEVSKKVVEEFEIPVPPLHEQKRIAAILDKADAIRRKRQQAIELADQCLRSVFLDMFGDPVANPKRWDSQQLGSSLRFLTSGSRGWAKYYRDKGDKFIRIQNVGKNALLLDDMTYVEAPKSAEADRTRLELGDVLLSITADLGRSAVATEEIIGGYINQHLALLRPDAGILRPRYLSAFLSSQGGVRQFQIKNKSAVKAGLNFDDIRTLEIPIPPISLQHKYEEIFDKVRCSAGRLQDAKCSAGELFESLSQRAFAGQL